MKPFFAVSDPKTIFINFLLLVATTLTFVPFLIATFSSPAYFALQTLKQTSANEKHILSTSAKELQLIINLEKAKLEFEKSKLNVAFKLATLEAETKIKEMKSLLEHEFKTMNCTMYTPLIEIEAANKHLIEMAKAEQATKLEERKIELERYRERRVLLKQMVPNWERFDGAGLLTSFLIKERTQ